MSKHKAAAFSQWPSMLGDKELDELDRLLRARGGDHALLLDGIHGFLTALAVGPVDVSPEEWLPKILESDPPHDRSTSRILDLLARLSAAIPVEISLDAYQPILGELDPAFVMGNPDEPQLSAAGWCEGFSRGVDLYAPLWEQRFIKDPKLMQILSPIVALAVDEGVLAGDMEIEKLTDDEYDECLLRMPQVLSAVANYWRTRAPSETEYRRAVSTSRPVPKSRNGHWLH